MALEFTSNPQPGAAAWKSEIVKLLESMSLSDFPDEVAETFLYQICLSSIRRGTMTTFAEAQSYLRRLGSPIQLAAVPVTPSEGLVVRSYDVLTGEDRRYYLEVVNGHGELERRLGQLGMSAELNEKLLIKDTGIVEHPW
jgi:hypothetical protein